MKIFIDIEDKRFAYLKDWLSEKYELVTNMNEADVIILGIHKKNISIQNKKSIVISFHPIEKCVNYNLNQCERFLQKNAYLTAIGLLKLIDIKDKKVVIFGNGRIASALYNEIKQPVTIICRHPKENERDMNCLDYLDADIIINTIPYPLNLRWDEIKKTAQLIDLASYPYGFDIKYLENIGLDAKLLSGIPGKIFPKEAAQIIYKEVMSCLAN